MLNENCKYLSNNTNHSDICHSYCDKNAGKKEKYCEQGSGDSTMGRVMDHYTESLKYFSTDEIVGIFLQGSQNYNLETPSSDIDTKLIVVPSFKDICLNHKPVSTTHVRDNNEHTDWKDIRLYVETFRKQNLNFIEILFTPYKYINPIYEEYWNFLIENRENIARMNPYRAVKSMKGIAMEKFHAMEHPYPSKLDILTTYGYDPKQLHHLIRVDNFLTKYIAGEKYEKCLLPDEKMKNFLLEVKKGIYNLEEARALANISINHVTKISDQFCTETEDYEDAICRELLNEVSYNIMKIAVKKELKI